MPVAPFLLSGQCRLFLNLTTIGGPWYFARAVVFQRLINQSFYQEILLLQKFNEIGGKVLKPKKRKEKKISSPISEKKMRPIFGEQTSQILEPSPQGLISSKFI